MCQYFIYFQVHQKRTLVTLSHVEILESETLKKAASKRKDRFVYHLLVKIYLV